MSHGEQGFEDGYYELPARVPAFGAAEYANGYWAGRQQRAAEMRTLIALDEADARAERQGRRGRRG